MADDALTAVVTRRFLIFLFKVSGRPPRPVKGTETIADVTDFTDEDVVDQQVRQRVNRDDTDGLGDILASNLEPGSLKTTTTIGKAVGIVLAHVRPKTHEDYVAFLHVRIRAMFHDVLAKIASKPPGDIQDGDPIATYAPSPLACARVSTDSRQAFDKFLLTALPDIDCQQTVQVGVDGLIRLMVVK